MLRNRHYRIQRPIFLFKNKCRRCGQYRSNHICAPSDRFRSVRLRLRGMDAAPPSLPSSPSSPTWQVWQESVPFPCELQEMIDAYENRGTALPCFGDLCFE
jgi:hypothetical protein